MEEEIQEIKRSPLIYIGAIFLILLLIVFIIPVNSIKWMPQPTNIPSVEEVLQNSPYEDEIFEFETLEQAENYPVTPFLKQVSSKIAGSCPSHSKDCYAKAIYLFVRDNIGYVSDPKGEYFEAPRTVLFSGSADCDGHAILLHLLLKSVGVSSKIVTIPGHAYVQAYVERDLLFGIKSKKQETIDLDTTCKSCEYP